MLPRFRPKPQQPLPPLLLLLHWLRLHPLLLRLLEPELLLLILKY